jgi:hypothetical protein
MRPSPARAALLLAAALSAVLAEGVGAAMPAVEPSLQLGLDSAFDSNVMNGRGPDMVNRITPRASLWLHDPRFDLKLGYDLGYWVYMLGTAESSLNHRGVVALDARLSRRVTLHVGDEIIYAGDPGFLLRAGVVAPQTSIFDNIADAGFGYRIGRRLDGNVDYTYRHTSFGPPPPGNPPLFNGDQHDASASIGGLAGRLDIVRLGYRFTYYSADSTNLAYANSPSLGWLHRLRRDLELRVEGGPLVFHLFDNGLASAAGLPGSGVTWRGAALLRFYRPTWRFALTFTRDLVGGTGAATVLWADYLTAQAGYHLDGKLDVRGGVGYFANGFAPNAPRLFDGVTVDAFVDWTVRPELHFAVYYSFRWQEAFPHVEAAAPLPDVTRQVVGIRLIGVIGAEAHPPRRLRPAGP